MHREIRKAAIGITVVLAALVATSAICYRKFVLPNVRKADTLKLIHDLQKAAADYQADYGTLPAEEHALVAALGGGNAEGKDYLPEETAGTVTDGVIRDAYGTPLKHITGESKPRFVSAGPDLAHGTEDDLSDDDLAEIFRLYGIFQKEEERPFADLKGRPH